MRHAVRKLVVVVVQMILKIGEQKNINSQYYSKISNHRFMKNLLYQACIGTSGKIGGKLGILIDRL